MIRLQIGITTKVAHEVPQPILALGLAGQCGTQIRAVLSVNNSVII